MLSIFVLDLLILNLEIHIFLVLILPPSFKNTNSDLEHRTLLRHCPKNLGLGQTSSFSGTLCVWVCVYTHVCVF